MKKTTVTFNNEEFQVTYNHDYEPAVPYYPDGSGYPGCNEIEIIKISWDGKDVTELINALENTEYFENAIQNMEKYGFAGD